MSNWCEGCQDFAPWTWNIFGGCELWGPHVCQRDDFNDHHFCWPQKVGFFSSHRRREFTLGEFSAHSHLHVLLMNAMKLETCSFYFCRREKRRYAWKRASVNLLSARPKRKRKMPVPVYSGKSTIVLKLFSCQEKNNKCSLCEVLTFAYRWEALKPFVFHQGDLDSHCWAVWNPKQEQSTNTMISLPQCPSLPQALRPGFGVTTDLSVSEGKKARPPQAIFACLLQMSWRANSFPQV